MRSRPTGTSSPASGRSACASPALPPTEAYGASGPTRTEHVVRWLYFLALALVIGSLGFRLLCLRGLALPPAVEKRLYLVSAIGVVGVLELGIVAFCLRSEDVLQLPFGKFLYGDLSPISGGTRFGKAFIAMTLGFALVAAFIYLAWLLERAVLLWPALALALGFVGRALALGPRRRRPGLVVEDRARRLGAPLGGVALDRRARLARRRSGSSRRSCGARLFSRFSRLATVLVALVLAAGTYLSDRAAAALRRPLDAGLRAGAAREDLARRGRAGLGRRHHFLVRPRLARAGDGFLARVGRSLAGESARRDRRAALAAILVDSKPPPRPAPAGRPGSPPLTGEQLEQPRRVGRRGRLVLVAEVDVRRRAQLRRERAQVVVGVRRLAQPDVTERLGREVVDGDDALDAGPRLVAEVERELERRDRPSRARRRGGPRRARSAR